MFYFEHVSDPTLQFIGFLFTTWYTIDKEPFSYLKKMTMFKKYLSLQRLLSLEVLIQSHNYINQLIHTHYLAKKYSKLWITNMIRKKSSVNMNDLQLYPLNKNKPYFEYIDYAQRQRYHFTIAEFTKLIRTNLEHCYSYDIVPQPLEIKNPYTNKVFTKEELSTISMSLHNMPLVWHLFVDSGFDVKKMLDNHYQYLLKMCIPSYVDQLDETDILFYIEDIFIFYSINTYCTKCINERVHFRSNKIRGILIEWIDCLKFSKVMNSQNIITLLSMYDHICPIHRKKADVLKKRKIDSPNGEPIVVKDIDESFLDLSKPFIFTMGTYTKEDKRRYKDKRREKNRINKNVKTKTI